MISLVVLTHNRWGYTKQCLTRISEVTDRDFQLIVLDSASVDETRDELKRIKLSNDHLVDFKFIFFRDNIGCRAINAGFATAMFDILLKVDNDVLLPYGWASYLVKASSLFPDVMFGANPVFITEKTVQFPNPGCISHSIDGVVFDEIVTNQNISGTFMAMKRDVYERIGKYRAPANSGYGGGDSLYCTLANEQNVTYGYLRAIQLEMIPGSTGPFTPEEGRTIPHVVEKRAELVKWHTATCSITDAPIELIIQK